MNLQLCSRVFWTAVAGISIAAAGCGGGEEVDVKNFEGYGAGHPGKDLPAGGEVRFELVKTPEGRQLWPQAFFRKWNQMPSNPPLSGPALGLVPLPADGTCKDITPPPPLPMPVPDGVTDVDLGPNVTVTSEPQSKAVVMNKFTNQVENYGRVVNLLYGGNMSQAGTDPGLVEEGAHYQIRFNGSDNLSPNRFFMPRLFTMVKPSIGSAPVVFRRGQPVDIEWDEIETEPAEAHTLERSFPVVLLVGANAAKVFICNLNDGQVHSTFTVPAEIIDQLPDEGTVQVAQLTHMLGAYDGYKFDLYGVSCNLSPFTKQ